MNTSVTLDSGQPAAEPSGESVEAPSETPAPPASEAPAENEPIGEDAPTDYSGLDPSFDVDDIIEVESEKPSKEGDSEAPPKGEAEAPEGEQEEKSEKEASEEEAKKSQEEKPKEEAAAEKVKEEPSKEEAQAAETPKEEPDSGPLGALDLAKQLQENKAKMIDALASERFQLSKEEQDALEEDAVAAIPKLLARAMIETSTVALNQIGTLVPQMIQQHMALSQATSAAEEKFYGMFDQLDKEKHGEDVQAFAQSFRASSPQIDQDSLFSMVGAAVMAKHGIKPEAKASNGDGEQPNTPPKPKSKPFVPAQQGAAVVLEKEPESPYAGLGQDFDE